MTDLDQSAHVEARGETAGGRDEDIGYLELATVLVARWRLLVIAPIVIGALALAATTPALMPPTFTGRTTFLPPQQSQGIAGSALASLGALAGLAGGSVKTTSDQYVAELRHITSELALTEAQQRRVFFETELKSARAKLATAQQALQNGGFNAGALKAEPQAAAESYARIKANATDAEVKLESMRSSLADTAPEVQRQQALLAALRSQLDQLERNAPAAGDADYVSRFREFKYQEKLVELFSQQYESARVDESRDGAVVQVVDPAIPPELKSGPKRVLTAIAAAVISGLILLLWVLLRYYWQQAQANPVTAEKLRRLRAAWRS